MESKDYMEDLLITPPTVDEAIEKAARWLGYGWVISIKVEKDGYGVELESPSYDIIDVDGGDGMRSDINAAILISNDIPIV